MVHNANLTEMRVALYCHTDSRLTPWEADKELYRQQQILENYASERGLVVTACYHHIGSSAKDPSFHQMLLDSVRRKFSTILVERFSRFPMELAEDIPEVHLSSIFENSQMTIGGYHGKEHTA